MAEARLVPRCIYSRRSFLQMSATARDLMTYLILYSDNDGIVEAYAVMDMIHAHPSDLQVLVERQFIYPLNDDLICYIENFQEFNKGLEKRYFKVSAYRDELIQKRPDLANKLVIPQKKKKKDEDNNSVSDGYPADVRRISAEEKKRRKNEKNIIMRHDYDIQAIEQALLADPNSEGMH